MKLNQLADRPGARKNRTRIGRGIGSGTGKTGGRGGKGPDRALGRAHQGLRGRPDAACTAACPSAASRTRRLRRSSTRSISRRVQAAIDAGKLECRRHGRCRGAGRGRRAAPCQGRGPAAAASGEIKAKGRIFSVWGASKSAVAAVEKAGGSVADSGAEAAGSRRGRLTPMGTSGPIPIYGRRRRRHRAARWRRWGVTQGGGREIAMASAAEQLAANLNFLGARQGRGAEEAHLVHARRAAGLPVRHLHPAARHRSFRLGADLQAAGRRHPRHVQHVLRRRHPPDGDLRARTSCPTSRPRSSSS